MTKRVKTEKILAALFQSPVVFCGEIMPKVNVFIVDELESRILLRFLRVGRKKASWIARQWRKEKVNRTSVLICDSAIPSLPLLPQRFALQSPTSFC